MSDRCDLIVLSTGVAGAEVAAQAARHGLDVLVIEQRLVGGEWPLLGMHPVQGDGARRRRPRRGGQGRAAGR